MRHAFSHSRWSAVSVGTVRVTRAAPGFWTLACGYWTFALLGIAAVVLLLLGAPTKAALAGAGFAFVGAAVTRLIDIVGERRLLGVSRATICKYVPGLPARTRPAAALPRGQE